MTQQCDERKKKKQKQQYTTFDIKLSFCRRKKNEFFFYSAINYNVINVVDFDAT